MRSALKSAANFAALCLAFPAACAYWISAWVLGPQQAFPGWSQAASLWPGLSGAYLRRAFYRLVLPCCEGGSVISFGTVFSHPSAALGRDVYIGPFCCLGDVTLEQDVLIGSHVSIMNGSRQHGIQRLDIPVREQPGVWPKVRIGCDSWIGDRAIVMVDVGQHCVVGAGAVVTKPVPDYAIVVGSPAKIVGWRGGERPSGSEDEQSISDRAEAAMARSA